MGHATRQPPGLAPLGSQMTYTAQNRVETSTGPDGVVTRLTYDALGQVATRTVGYGTALARAGRRPRTGA